MSARTAAPIVRQAWLEVFGREPTQNELVFALTQAAYESGFGRFALPGACGDIQSNNWGAVQANAAWSGDKCLGVDSNADGSPYEVYFRVYPTPLDGAKDWLRMSFGTKYKDRGSRMLAAAKAADNQAFAAAIVESGYSVGHGPNLAARIASIRKAVDYNRPIVERSLGVEARPGPGGGFSGSGASADPNTLIGGAALAIGAGLLFFAARKA